MKCFRHLALHNSIFFHLVEQVQSDETTPESDVNTPRRSPRVKTPKPSTVQHTQQMQQKPEEKPHMSFEHGRPLVASPPKVDPFQIVQRILGELKSFNPIATRISAAIELASECTKPVFVDYIRANEIAKKVFVALRDASQSQSLGLCTATIMFLLSRENFDVHFDADSLKLMLALGKCEEDPGKCLNENGLTVEQSNDTTCKISEIFGRIQDKAKSTEEISIKDVVSEILLTNRSKAATMDWFKNEMRKSGGIDFILNTLCELCKEIQSNKEDSNEICAEIDRHLRLLAQMMQNNNHNKMFISKYENGIVLQTLSEFQSLCQSKILSEDYASGDEMIGVQKAAESTATVLSYLMEQIESNTLKADAEHGRPLDAQPPTVDLLNSKINESASGNALQSETGGHLTAANQAAPQTTPSSVSENGDAPVTPKSSKKRKTKKVCASAI